MHVYIRERHVYITIDSRFSHLCIYTYAFASILLTVATPYAYMCIYSNMHVYIRERHVYITIDSRFSHLCIYTYAFAAYTCTRLLLRASLTYVCIYMHIGSARADQPRSKGHQKRTLPPTCNSFRRHH